MKIYSLVMVVLLSFLHEEKVNCNKSISVYDINKLDLNTFYSLENDTFKVSHIINVNYKHKRKTKNSTYKVEIQYLKKGDEIVKNGISYFKNSKPYKAFLIKTLNKNEKILLAKYKNSNLREEKDMLYYSFYSHINDKELIEFQNLVLNFETYETTEYKGILPFKESLDIHREIVTMLNK